MKRREKSERQRARESEGGEGENKRGGRDRMRKRMVNIAK